MPGLAQDFLSRPVRIVVPVAPGGPTDTIGRVLAEELNQRQAGNFFVENRPGAGSTSPTPMSRARHRTAAGPFATWRP